MLVNLELYRVFREVAATGSFSQAARNLYITQSAVSQSIAQLESRLDRKLFERSRRGVTLTPEGAMLYEHISAALGMIATGEEKLERMRHLQAGELTIGAGDTISKHYLLPYLERFHGRYPEIRLKVVNRTSGQLIALLRSGNLDLAFANLPLGDPDLEITECMQVHDVFVASEQRFGHLKDRALDGWELAKCHLIMLETQSNSRCYVDEYFLQGGVRLEPEIELGAHDLLLDFARIGLGIACVIREFSREALAEGGLFQVRLKKPVPARAIGLCRPAGVSPSFAAQRFIELCGLPCPAAAE